MPPPAAMAATSRSPAGTSVWPWSFCPQAATVPSVLSATRLSRPAAMAATSRSPAGTGWPGKGCSPPGDDGAVRLERHRVVGARGDGHDVAQSGRHIHRRVVPPQATTVPSALSATVCSAPAAMATTSLSPAGTVVVEVIVPPRRRRCRPS